MTTLVKIAITLTLSILIASCGIDFNNGEKGNGNVISETREVREDFTSISASEGLNIYVTQTNDFNIKVESDENIIDLIGTDIQGKTLKIYAIKNIGRATKNIYVSLPNISSLKCSSGAQLIAKNEINATRLTLDASSGAILKAKLVTENAIIDASSGANITLSGTTRKSAVDASSGANINANDLNSSICNAQASSGANVNLNVTESLHADASSGGNISYSGTAKVSAKKNISGSITFID